MVLKLSCVAADLAAQRCFVFNPCVVRALAVLDPGRLVGADPLRVVDDVFAGRTHALTSRSG